MSDAPFVSVLIPACNAAGVLEEAVTSMLDQTLPPSEIVIVDDASEDRTRDVMRALAEKDRRVRLLFNEERLGDPKNRNRLLRAADPRTEFVAIMDADDVSESQRLEKQVGYLLLHPDVAVVGSHLTMIDETGQVIGRRKYALTPSRIAFRRYLENPFAHPAVTARMSALRAVTGYDESRQRACDYDLWMRVLATHRGANIDEFLLRYRIWSSQSKAKRTRAILEATLGVKLRHVPWPWLAHPVVAGRMLAEGVLWCLPPRATMALFRRWHQLG